MMFEVTSWFRVSFVLMIFCNWIFVFFFLVRPESIFEPTSTDICRGFFIISFFLLIWFYITSYFDGGGLALLTVFSQIGTCLMAAYSLKFLLQCWHCIMFTSFNWNSLSGEISYTAAFAKGNSVNSGLVLSSTTPIIGVSSKQNGALFRITYWSSFSALVGPSCSSSMTWTNGISSSVCSTSLIGWPLYPRPISNSYCDPSIITIGSDDLSSGAGALFRRLNEPMKAP